jgi:hypothetical protein
MKPLLIALLLVSTSVWADDCRTTTVTIERDGQVHTDTATVCKEGTQISDKIKIGDTILESEVAVNQKVAQYFTYRNSRCRLFQEHQAKDKKLRVNNGVICQIDGSDTNWIVVDKW